MTTPQHEWVPTVTLNSEDHPLAIYLDRTRGANGEYAQWVIRIHPQLEANKAAVREAILSLNVACTGWYMEHYGSEVANLLNTVTKPLPNLNLPVTFPSCTTMPRFVPSVHGTGFHVSAGQRLADGCSSKHVKRSNWGL